MERPLYLAPQEESDRGRGKDFLYEFETGGGAEVGGERGGDGVPGGGKDGIV